MRDKNLENLLKEIKAEPIIVGLTQKEKDFFTQIKYLYEIDYRAHRSYINRYIRIMRNKNRKEIK